MRIHRENKFPDDIFNIFFLDRDNNIIIEFEDKSRSLGSKIAVYDNFGYPIYLIDDTTSIKDDYSEITILQDLKEIIKLKIPNNFFTGFNVFIKAEYGEYNFNFRHRALEKEGVLIAEIKPHPIKVEALIDDIKDLDGKTKNKEKSNLGIIKLLRTGKVNLLNHIDFDVYTDDPNSLKLYLTMLYSIQLLVVNKISTVLD